MSDSATHLAKGSANDSVKRSAKHASVQVEGSWFVYIVQCANGSFYTGITTDVARRFAEHQAGAPKGAKALRGKGPLTLVLSFAVADRALASQIEYRVKQLSRVEKQALVKGGAKQAKIDFQLDALLS